ncbi:MAG: hypothetical protein ACRDIV_17715 [Ktedonobacteraceae bacterium]
MAAQRAHSLHLIIEPDGSLKVGSCEHCVVKEVGRPDRAWDPMGDSELDFDRDQMIQRLAALGVQVTITQEYVCP